MTFGRSQRVLMSRVITFEVPLIHCIEFDPEDLELDFHRSNHEGTGREHLLDVQSVDLSHHWIVLAHNFLQARKTSEGRSPRLKILCTPSLSQRSR